MSRLLIGSSNVYRNYSPKIFPRYKHFDMVKCTRIEQFMARMGCLDTGVEEIIISVMENFLSDAIEKEQSMEKFGETIDQTIKQYLGTINEAVKKLPLTKFAIVKPTLRPKHQWYMENYEEICKHHED